MGSTFARFRLPLTCAALVCGLPWQTFLDARVPETTLGIILTTAPRVSAGMRAALIDETTRIWEQAGVRLTWAPAPVAATRRTLRILAVNRPQVQPRSDSSVLGELMRVDQSKAIAMVSVSEAERIVTRAGSMRDRQAGEQRVGIVLGRAAAHEIGHYLLNTSTHAANGLMRPQFDELEFARATTSAFDLDPEAQTWIRRQLTDGGPIGPPVAVGVTPAPLLSGPARAFSYAP